MNILLAVATEAEIMPTLEWLDRFKKDNPILDQVQVCITGVGLLAATYQLTRALAEHSIGFVIGAGIAGAFSRDIHLSECVIVQSEQLADFGAEDGETFLDAFSMGLANSAEAPFTQGRLVNPMETSPFPAGHLRHVSGLTVLTVSGYEPTIAERVARYGADVESMEGAALHYACGRLGVAYIQLRAISNYVTRRDRSAWKMGEAIAALNKQLLEWLKLLANEPAELRLI